MAIVLADRGQAVTKTGGFWTLAALEGALQYIQMAIGGRNEYKVEMARKFWPQATAVKTTCQVV